MTLFLFTAAYPYGQSETFLEEELPILAMQFNSIEIVPLNGIGDPTREVPNNVKVHKPIISGTQSKWRIGMYFFNTFNRLFWGEFFKKKVYLNLKRLKTWAIAYRNTCIISKSVVIHEIEERLTSDDICYYYWGKGLNLLSLMWKDKACHVSRFHGEWDLWEESSGNYAPLRDKLAKALDLAVFISKKGEDYFGKKYPYCRTCVSRLGAKDVGIAQKSTDGILRVVSCSSVYPLKRVPLIYKALTQMSSHQIEWTHIGNGCDFNNLRTIVEGKTYSHLKVRLLGQLAHKDVIQYYVNNTVDLFINMSTNEGIPVSIMEAISFDIPIVATNVGGTSEIVTPESGVLLSENPSTDEIITAIERVINGTFTPRKFWNKTYNSENNYTEFCRIIKEL